MTTSSSFRHIVELKREGRLPEALHELEKALESQPDDLFLMASLADTLVRMKRPTEAKQVIDGVLAVDPEHQPGLIALGDLHRAAGRNKDALEAYRLAAWNSRTGSCRLTPYLAKRQAQVLSKLGELERAEELLRQALATHPDDRALQVELASVLLKRQKAEDALTLLESLTTVYPEDRWIKNLLLEARARSRPAEQVARELDLALSTGAGRANSDLWRLKALRAKDEGRWLEAGESYLEAHRLEPAQAFYIQQAGFSFKKAGELARAVECLEPEFLQDPSNRYVRGALVSCLRSLGEQARLLELFDRAIARRPDLVQLIGMRKKMAAPPSSRARVNRRKRATA